MLEKLIAENHARFLAFVRSRVKDSALAEDVLQAAYQKGLTKYRSLRKDERIVAWFYRILRNTIIDHYRSQGLETARRGHEAEAEAIPEELNSQLEKSLCRCVEGLIPLLKPEYADAIREVELNEKSLKEFAREQGLSANNATVRLYRARQSLKKQLLNTCGTCAEHACLDCSCRRV
jgi:RNA polymerase sigma factor (sigma-70 family)